MENFPNATTKIVTEAIDLRIARLKAEHVVLWLDAIGVPPRVWKGRLSYGKDKNRKLSPGERYVIGATRKSVAEYLAKNFNARPRLNANAVYAVAGVAAIANLTWKALTLEALDAEKAVGTPGAVGGGCGA